MHQVGVEARGFDGQGGQFGGGGQRLLFFGVWSGSRIEGCVDFAQHGTGAGSDGMLDNAQTRVVQFRGAVPAFLVILCDAPAGSAL